MEKLLIFMYRHWIEALLLSAVVVAVCIGLAEHLECGAFGRFISLLPFQLTVTAYYVSMLVVRKRYQRTDEIRYRAHYIRGLFHLLFIVGWMVPVAVYLATGL